MLGPVTFGHYLESYFEERGQNDFYKTGPSRLDFPRRELSNVGLKIVVALLVRWQINFLSAQT